MLNSVADALSFSAKVEDDSFSIKDVFFDVPSGRMRYLCVDVGGWFSTQEVAVAIERAGKPDTGDRSWPLSMTKDEVESAPSWQTDQGKSLLPLEKLPPIVVGPFGNTQSPLMLYAQMTEGKDVPPREADHAETLTESLDRASDWMQRDVFGTGGEIGTIVDLLFDAEAREVTHFVVDTGKIAARKQVVVPFETLSHRANDHGHVVLSCSSEQIDDAPLLESLDKVDRTWINSVRAYYGLSL